MDRITYRDEKNRAFYTACKNCNIPEKSYEAGTDSSCYGCYQELASCAKLADYEDAEEKGRLIKLPVAIGDHVWGFPSEAEHYREMQVVGLCYEFGAIYVEAQDVITCKSVYFDAKCLGGTVFLTEKEAEAKLAEIEAQNGQADKI